MNTNSIKIILFKLNLKSDIKFYIFIKKIEYFKINFYIYIISIMRNFIDIIQKFYFLLFQIMK